MSDLCVCCGAAVPEGRQVCPNCEKPKTDKPFTNGDRFRAMNDGELSVFLNGTFVCECCVYGGTCTEPYNMSKCITGVREWLSQPAKEVQNG